MNTYCLSWQVCPTTRNDNGIEQLVFSSESFQHDEKSFRILWIPPKDLIRHQYKLFPKLESIPQSAQNLDDLILASLKLALGTSFWTSHILKQPSLVAAICCVSHLLCRTYIRYPLLLKIIQNRRPAFWERKNIQNVI